MNAVSPRPPLGLLAELTHRCPLQCPYCSNPVEMTRRNEELSAAEWADIFGQAAAMGVLQLHLSGGEPTARPDLPEIIRAAESAGLYTNLITSGVLLDAARLESYLAAGLNHVQLSIQGAEAASADRIGGMAGAFAKKADAARLVAEAGLPLTVNAVVHRQNLDGLEAIVALALDWGAQRLEVAHVQYYGWALKNRAALMPTRAQIDRATAIVEAARRLYAGRLEIDYVVPDYYATRPKRCMDGWASQFLVVTPRGRVLPCHAAESLKGFEFPNLRDTALADIWTAAPAFQRFRGTDWMPEPCRSCAFKERDLGGCRCQAFALTGDAAATDPACALSPHHAELLATATDESAAAVADFTYRNFANAAL